ncbi:MULTISPECIES: hypothetical protein [unclassified Sphingobium]|uniref:hypothetical protein n=1 Tax=unclassified Sphingobium TaxID=2611147 RepID=UPI001199F5DA|nr:MULTISPECIES: hypothetical protein [unclassified Sphingobium]MBG6119275.1 hypothetical protein [Sphingobium sp. JAI105]TWD01545.1 hypothetical protein FB595_11683 [Sphingobium sp. AEW010]TWD20123.1 hypothetical protein FB596_11640 [Sphingobium sp. AEW013]TWD23154.1 hypothetical protein FB594_11683 [Sphingobium sp. AEW001]
MRKWGSSGNGWTGAYRGWIAWGGLAVMSGQLLFVLVAMVHDLRSRGRVHAACWIGAAVIAVEGLAVPILAATPPVIALTEALARS